MDRFKQIWQTYQNRSGLLLLLLTALLGADFMFRLRVPLDSTAILTLPALPVAVTSHQASLPASAPMLQWLAKSAPAASDTAAVDATNTPDMTGASQLGSLQVRVRAIFIRPGAASQTMVLIESYQQAEKQHIIERYRLGDSLGDYQLVKIAQHEVAFTPVNNTGETNPVVIPVFHFNSGNP